MTMAGSRRATRHLHAQEPEPPPGGEALPGVGGVVEGELAVDGDRVVQRREERPAVVDQAEHARAEALVVVDEVELAPAAGQQPCGPGCEKASGSPKPAVHMTRELGRRRPGRGTRGGAGPGTGPGPGRGRGPGTGVKPDALVELRPGLAGEDLDRVAEGDQLPGEVAGVDALAAADAGCPGR